MLLSQADAALSELSGLGRYLPNPDLLITSYIRHEAIASSRIEGTRADLSDLLMDEVDPQQTPVDSDLFEVRNYLKALHEGIQSLDSLPLSGRLIRQMHATLMSGVRGQEKTPGEYRRSQNWIGPPGSTLATATYVPPPHDPEMHECIKHWERFINLRDTLPELIQCALMHEHFEAIHPFLDGNGRIGRLLITLFLIERKRLSQPLLYLSAYIEQHKHDYYDLLQRVRTHGDWNAWLRFFLVAVRDTSRSAIAQSEAILALRAKYQQMIRKRHQAHYLIDDLFLNPYVTVSSAGNKLGVSAPTASKAIDQLVKAGMLQPATRRTWKRLWVAQPIVDLVQNFNAFHATA